MVSCPNCESQYTVKNGRIHNGKQNYKCQSCRRQFVQDPQNKVIEPATKDLIDKLLERLSLAGIALSDRSFGTLASTLCQHEICSSTAKRESAG